MSNTHHTPIATGASANANTFNVPLGQLDQTILDLQSGTKTFDTIKFDDATTKTIASGVITPDKSLHIIAAETGTTDNLDTITAVNKSLLFLKADSGDTITITTSGNVTNTPAVFSGNQIVALYCENDQWCVISGGGDASAVGYVENDVTDYNYYYTVTDVGNVDDALDALAARRWRKGYVVGLEVNVSDNIFVTVTAGECLNPRHEKILATNTVTNLSTAVSGIGGIDTGSVAINTWYFVWICKGSSGTGLLLSTSSGSPTVPAGYNTYYKRIGAVKTDASGNLYKQKTETGQHNRRIVRWIADTTAAPFQIYDGTRNVSTTTSWDTVDCSGAIPSTATKAILYIESDGGSGTTDLWWRLDANEKHMLMRVSTALVSSIVEIPVTSGAFEITSSTNVDEDFELDVQGYIDDINSNYGTF